MAHGKSSPLPFSTSLPYNPGTMNTRFNYRTWLASAVLALGTAPAWAQTGPGLVMKPFVSGMTFEGQTSQMVFAQASTNQEHNPASLNINDSSFRAKLPMGSDRGGTTQPAGDQGSWMDLITEPVIGYQHTWIHLDTSHSGLPSNLFDQSLAFGCTFYRTELWKFAALAGMGWAGQDPYADADSLYGKASLVAQRQLDAKSCLILSLNYNGNGVMFPDIPLPGVAYSRRESETLSYTLGVPFSSVTWEPVERLTIDATFGLPYDFEAKVSYELCKPVAIFTCYDSRMQAFRVQDDNSTRHFFGQNTLEAGVNYTPCRFITFTLAGGYAMGTRTSTGYDARNLDTVTRMSDTPYGRVGAELRF